MVRKILSRKTPSQKNGLVEWLKLKALSSSPSTHTKEVCVWVRRRVEGMGEWCRAFV
jgi:hypothetical protein